MSAIEQAQAQFHPQVTYLNTPTAGLPPQSSLDAVAAATAKWQAGTMNPPEFDDDVNRARTAFAALSDVPPEWVAIGSQVSVFAGLVAVNLPDDAEILTVTGDFTSVLYPMLLQRKRGVTVREVPLGGLADAVTERTTLVAVSAVQSANGAVADLDRLAEVCAQTGTRTFVDTSHAIGWLPAHAQRFSYTACAAYKWLLSPRGTAFFTVQPELMDALTPHTSGWYASEKPWEDIYSSSLPLAKDARRYDLSPAWLGWVGAAPAIELLAGVGVEALHEHSVGLANQFRRARGMPDGDSAVVSLAIEDGEQTAAALREAQVVASVRAGRLRLGFHLANTASDVLNAVQALKSRT